MRWICICALLACATGYQSRGALGGGFSEVQLGDNTFRITFTGNLYTEPDAASEYALRRSAEVTQEKGFRYFVVASAENTVTPNGPTAVRTIVCYKEKPEGSTALVYDAAMVNKSLQAKSAAKEPAPRTAQVCKRDMDCDSGTCIEGLCR